MQQINLIYTIEGNEEATMFSSIEKPEETSFNFSQNTVIII